MDQNLANPSLSTILISEAALVGLDKQVSKVALGRPTKIQLVLLKFITPISFEDKCKYQTKKNLIAQVHYEKDEQVDGTAYLMINTSTIKRNPQSLLQVSQSFFL